MELNMEENRSHQSLGMQVTQERLEILSKEKGVNIIFDITDLKDENGVATGTQVVFNIPFEVDSFAQFV